MALNSGSSHKGPSAGSWTATTHPAPAEAGAPGAGRSRTGRSRAARAGQAAAVAQCGRAVGTAVKTARVLNDGFPLQLECPHCAILTERTVGYLKVHPVWRL